MADPAPLDWHKTAPAELQAFKPAIDPRQRLTNLACRLSTTVALARALKQGGRQLDLAGVEDGVGILCAQALDLPPDDARLMLPVLHEVLAQVEMLAETLQDVPDAPRC